MKLQGERARGFPTSQMQSQSVVQYRISLPLQWLQAGLYTHPVVVPRYGVLMSVGENHYCRANANLDGLQRELTVFRNLVRIYYSWFRYQLILALYWKWYKQREGRCCIHDDGAYQVQILRYNFKLLLFNRNALKMNDSNEWMQANQ